MSRGKYSPTVHGRDYKNTSFTYNCYGGVPAPWNKEIADAGIPYDEKTMFGDYDNEGFDSYGYSAFDAEGNYVGIGAGVDRNGKTENEYLCMSDEDYEYYN